MRIDSIKRLTYPGTLRHQITWQQPVDGAASASGEQARTWADVVTVKADVVALSGRELETAQRTWAEARYSVRQHYWPGFSATWRGYWWVDGAARYLEVLDMQEAGAGRQQIIICREQK